MPSFNTDVLPSTPFENLGSPTQPWNGYFGTINSGAVQIFGNTKVILTSSPTLVIDASGTTIIEIDMSQNVTSSTFTSNTSLGACQFILFRIVQDNTGGWSFAWPANFIGATLIDDSSFTMSANQVLHQMFLYDATSGYVYALGSGTLT